MRHSLRDFDTCEISPVVGPTLPRAGVEHLLHKLVEVLPRLPVSGADLKPHREHGAQSEVTSVQLRHIIPVFRPVHLYGALPASGNLEMKTIIKSCVNGVNFLHRVVIYIERSQIH